MNIMTSHQEQFNIVPIQQKNSSRFSPRAYDLSSNRFLAQSWHQVSCGLSSLLWFCLCLLNGEVAAMGHHTQLLPIKKKKCVVCTIHAGVRRQVSGVLTFSLGELGSLVSGAVLHTPDQVTWSFQSILSSFLISPQEYQDYRCAPWYLTFYVGFGY